ncbi:transcriptional regulator NrdR [Kamptonema cortianum]|uniref:Transcriptional repressor NrdR n=1 Tax=Geitlerinema calcuttense NRMC-F 0142 TaxID=2922238 RepID=A0ABT7LXA7_9CYAN|nr:MULTISPECIES: transcriptional regulator NrdR [Cyanophyceae]MDK3156678.1 transcriptional regulator NrdR [Kamptonema cortianum]MDL5050313.1 transcriptional regulator NrdR [Oscillatoria amoena NRMC-F 0135]MDL5055145.1 transcriptional regulator NrdR [Oscillatoria laete-virens NRMC-F 0139]MDL5056633.1 transcriptional regulator NrdR [Geitlerinema calcuttense NRMC-F 0142]
MKCPKCGCQDDKVIDSRTSREGDVIRRRRECLNCAHRYTTYEQVEKDALFVMKRDGRREKFDRSKLLKGIEIACQKRPVSTDQIERLVDEIHDVINNEHEREVPSTEVGELLMAKLREIDEVAYVRFASVYRSFRDINEFISEVNNLSQPATGASRS